MRKVWRYLATILVWLFLFVASFIYTFPAPTLKGWLERSLQERTGFDVSIQALEVGWNLALRIKGMDIEVPGKGERSFKVLRVSLRPDYTELLKGSPAVLFHGTLPQGGWFGGRYMSGDRISIAWRGVKVEALPVPPIPSLVGKDSRIEGEGELRLVRRGDLKPMETIRVRIEGVKGKRDLLLPPIPLSRGWLLTGRVRVRVQRP